VTGFYEEYFPDIVRRMRPKYFKSPRFNGLHGNLFLWDNLIITVKYKLTQVFCLQCKGTFRVLKVRTEHFCSLFCRSINNPNDELVKKYRRLWAHDSYRDKDAETYQQRRLS